MSNKTEITEFGVVGKLNDEDIYYKEDKQEGESKWWYENGQLYFQQYYKEGKRDGETEYWNEDGTLKEKIIYKDGEKQV